MNKAILIGRLTADPELKQTQSGVASVRFTLAVNRDYKDKTTGERQADFISCQAWRGTAEIISRYCNKGSRIAIHGSIRTGSYQDRNHPEVTHYTTDVISDSVELLDSKRDNTQPTNYYTATATQPVTAQQTPDNSVLADYEEILSDGDVPF